MNSFFPPPRIFASCLLLLRSKKTPSIFWPILEQKSKNSKILFCHRRLKVIAKQTSHATVPLRSGHFVDPPPVPGLKKRLEMLFRRGPYRLSTFLRFSYLKCTVQLSMLLKFFISSKFHIPLVKSSYSS